jgi:endonuclease YncB( thermonuclease family)
MEEAKLFSLDGTVVTDCIIHEIYDGDTFRVSAKFPQLTSPKSFKCRLRNIDTPELRTRDVDEKKLAYLARDYVVDAVRDIGVKEVQCYKFGKYGRLVVDVKFKDGTDLAKTLIDAKLGVAYDGKSSRKREDGFWGNMLQQHAV